MKKFLLPALLFLLTHKANSQELYVFTEPASNMPAKSVSLKLTGRFPKSNTFKHRYMPEVMIGLNKNWMFHISSTLSNYYSPNLRPEGGKLYAKYRFYSKDEVHSHFRMAAFGDVAFTRNPYVYDDINLEGDNKGVQGGLIATQLVNKLAISATVAYNRFFPQEILSHHTKQTLAAVNYSLSAGYLILPVEYRNYDQLNFNVYLEMLGMKSLDQGHYGIDLAPAIQFIFKSNSKVNIGHRFQVYGNMYRIANNTWQVSFEHTLFNAWK